MKRFVASALVALLIVGSVFAAGSKEDAQALKNEITVYAYDSFNGDWGPGPQVIPAFEEKTGIKVNVVSAGDGVEMISRIVMEGKNCPADVVLGIPDTNFQQVYDADFLMPYESPLLATVDEERIVDPEFRILPFDWGLFAFVYDTEAGINVPETLADLTKPEYKGQVILINPNTSTVGQGLLFWTLAEFGEDYLAWWEAMKENALTIADGWSTAYGLFTEGEAPIVLSYTTSPVYHVMNEDTDRYQTILMPAHQETVEGLGILKTASNVEGAKAFVDFILSEGQADIAILNSMYPVNSTIELPDAYDYAPIPETVYHTDQDVAGEKLNGMLKDWTEVMSK